MNTSPVPASSARALVFASAVFEPHTETVRKGKIAKESEAVMVIKTRRSLAEAAIAAARQRHPYTNPALIVIPLDGGITGCG